MWVRYLFSCLVCVLLCGGCTTSRDRREILSRILEDIESENKGSSSEIVVAKGEDQDSVGVDVDTPDRPVSALPPVPVPGGKVIEKADTKPGDLSTVSNNGRDSMMKGSSWGRKATEEMRRAARKR